MDIDAANTLLGRIATVAAKQALLGNKVNIYNCEKAIISGRKKMVLAHYKKRLSRGTYKGPFTIKNPDRFVKRTIRGMLPYKKERGVKAYKRIRCYRGLPENNKGNLEVLKNSQKNKLPTINIITVKEVCRHLGGKV